MRGYFLVVTNAIENCQMVDDIKKKVRDNDVKPITVKLLDENSDAFDIELADALYYINAIAINRGKTLEELAEMSFQKVLAKTQLPAKE